MALSENDQITKRIDDLISQNLSRFKPQFLGFLDEHQVQLARDYLVLLRNGNFRFFGGTDGAERCYLGIDAFSEIADNDFPITALAFSYRKQDLLSHRDFLGSLMGLGITRESVGDILVSEGKTIIFVSEKTGNFVLSQLQKVGRVGVKIKQVENSDVAIQKKFEIVQGTVASLRLDCIVSLICATGRKESKDLILGKTVSLNHQICQNIAKDILQGDKISVRGYGKFILEEIGNPTKKGRIHIKIKHLI